MKPLALVAENDGGTRRLLDVLLNRFGLEADLVPSGADAMLLLDSVDYDLLLVDQMLPGVSGVEILEWIARERPEMLSRCVLLWSGSPAQAERIQQQWPQVQILRKPFELTEIQDAAKLAASGPVRHGDTAVEQFCRRSVAAGAKSGIVLRRDRGQLEAVLSFGYRPEMLEPFLPLMVDAPYPLCIAVRNARPVWLASLTMAAPEYPSLVAVWERNRSQALASLPLMQDGMVIGVAGWAFREPRPFHESERTNLLGIAGDLAACLAETSQTASRAHA